MYVKLLLRAVSTILSPFGMDEEMLYRRVLKNINASERKVRQRPLFKRYSVMRTNDLIKNNLRLSADEEPPASSPQIGE